MVNDWQTRKKKAEEINKKIGDLAKGILIVGSVAYNPKAVTPKSDLDMVGILDFSSVDFKELYRRLGQKYEPLLVKYASQGKINNVSIVWDEEFEIGLHLWDQNAFKRVINLRDANLIFRRENFSRNFKSTADLETLKNLEGKKKKIYKKPKKIKGGTILKFFIFWEDSSGFYPGIQVCNLLLSPIVLSEQGKKISMGLEKFKKNLRKKLKKSYGSSNNKKNLYNAIASKLQKKVSLDLKNKLKHFF